LSKTEKTLERWRTATDENWTTVEAVLLKYGFVLKHGRGSHFTYLHPSLKTENTESSAFTAFGIYGANGEITITVHRNKVNRVYLNLILSAIKQIEDGSGDAKSGGK